MFTQLAASSHRRLWAVLLVLLGVVALVIGDLVWADDPAVDLDTVKEAVKVLVQSDSNMPNVTAIVVVSAAALIALIALSALLMLFGLIGAGRLVRVSAIFSALCGAGVMAAAPLAEAFSQPTGVDFDPVGLVLVIPGAAIAFIGGVLLKR